MDRDALSLLEAASISLGLNGPLPPWGLGLLEGQVREVARPPLPVVLDPVLAPATPRPYDLDPALVLEAFLLEDRLRIAAQLDDGYRFLRVLGDVRRGEADDEAVVKVQLGVPLIGRDRALVRIRTTNVYRDLSDLPQQVTGDFHAWLDPRGQVSTRLTDAQAALVPTWPRWIPGSSPGLSAREA